MVLATPAYRWSLVPVLTCAGFGSGVYTSMVIERMSYGTANPYAFTFFGSLSLGLALCAVLWAFHSGVFLAAALALAGRLILLDCSGTPRPVIDEFLKAYLAKYPSDL